MTRERESMPSSVRGRPRNSRAALAILAAALAASAFAGCKGGGIGGPMSPRDEEVLGRNAAQQIQAQEKFVTDPVVVRRVIEVAHPVFLQANKDRPDVTFSIHIIDDKEVNAFSIPGGFVYINKGLLDKIGSDDDALACVIGHESAHIVLHHVAKQISDEQNKGLLVNVAAILTKSDAVGQVGGTIAQLQSLHFSRQDEYEADRYGLRFAYGGGYDPAGMIRTFHILEELENKNGGQPMVYAADHPITRNRTLRAQEQLRELRANHGAYISEKYDPQGDRTAAERNGISYNALVLATTPSTPLPGKVDPKDPDNKNAADPKAGGKNDIKP